MHPTIESMFDAAENRYLEQDELTVLTSYVESLPERIETYRCLRDKEVTLMQAVADQLETQFSNESQQVLERCLKNALLIMRYVAMAMLQNDPEILDQKLMAWLRETNAVYNTQAIDAALYPLISRQLASTLTASQLDLVRPYLSTAEQAFTQPNSAPVAV
ncbi:MAG: hypothetical protein VKL39_17325 [Leptolyngbyaceae bacterium]|nr:hypothetical protein [Leptolyngbyaceae bacterium]